MMKLVSVVLAAGQGKRMKSDKAKVLHEVCGKSMVMHVLDQVELAGVSSHCVIVGHQREAVQEHLSEKNCKFAIQEEQLGTGHAVQMCEGSVPSDSVMLILCGDTPCLRSSTLQNFINSYKEGGFEILVLSTKIENPTGYGRIIRGQAGDFQEIREHRDCNKEQQKVDEINTGIYILKSDLAFELLKEVRSDNDQAEYYLTDIAKIAMQKGMKVEAVSLGTPQEFLGVNTVEQLDEARSVLESYQA